MLNSRQTMFIPLLIAMGNIDQACHGANMAIASYYNRLDTLLHKINFDKAKELMGTRIKPYFVINLGMTNILKMFNFFKICSLLFTFVYFFLKMFRK